MYVKYLKSTVFILSILLGNWVFSPKTAHAGYGVSVSYSSGSERRSHHGHHNNYRHHHGRSHHHNSWIGFRYYEPIPVYPYYPGRIYTLPRTAKFVWCHGQRYYYYHGIYYKPSIDNSYYTIVDDPFDNPQVTSTIINNYYQGNNDQNFGDSDAELSEFNVNFQNSKGEMVTVKIKKSGNGYIGPQGEFYPEFPKVAQLKEMYTN